MTWTRPLNQSHAPVSTSSIANQVSNVDGSLLTGITKAQVGLSNVVNIDTTNASNITSGTLANARTSATNTNAANAIVSRDGSGNFSAGAITANGDNISIGASFTPNNASIAANNNLLTIAQNAQGQINNLSSTIIPSIDVMSSGAALTNANRTVHVTATGQTFTFPDATTMTPNVEYNIKAIGVALVSINTFGSQTIDGASSYSLSVYQSATYYSDGANLFIR